MELWLLIVACIINASAIVLVQLGAMGRVDTQLLLLGAGLSALAFGLHIAMRFVARDADPFLLPIATVLNGLGIAMIYRIDIADGESGWESASVRQIVWSAIAIVAAIATILVIRNHRVLFRYTYLSGLLAIVLLLLPLVPGIGREVSGARCGSASATWRRSSPVRSRRSPWRSSSRDTWCATATRCRWSGARSSACGSLGRATSDRCSWCGRCRWRSSCSSATSAPPSSTSASSS
jgi:hypothetical protein